MASCCVEVDGVPTGGRDPGEQQLDGRPLQRLRSGDGTGSGGSRSDLLVGPPRDGGRRAQEPQALGVLDEVVEDLAQPVDRVDAVEHQQRCR